MFLTRDHLTRLAGRLGAAVRNPGRLYWIGETSLVWEGVRRWTDEIELAADLDAADRDAFDRAREAAARELGARIVDEHPRDVIPLPDGWRERSKPVSEAPTTGPLELLHFDPVAVAFRFLARGDEEDYTLILALLQNEWLEKGELDRQLEAVLPRFSFGTIAQDPEEFRRKYRGLGQMWRGRGGRGHSASKQP